MSGTTVHMRVRPRRIASGGWIAMLVATLLWATACGTARDTLVGDWRVDPSAEHHDTFREVRVTFFREGTVVFANGAMSAGGEYRRIDEGHVRIDLRGIWGILGPEVYEVRVDGDRLVLSSPRAGRIVLRKASLGDDGGP